MESMRLLQRKALQQLMQTRPTRPNLQHVQYHLQQAQRTKTVPTNGFARSIHTKRPSTRQFGRATRHQTRTTRRFDSTTASSSSSSDANLSLSQRLKKLSREYGWSALGVYLALSALDFPFCFLAVRLLGTDRIGHWEHVVLSYFKDVVKWPMTEPAQQQVDDAADQVKAVAMKQQVVPIEELRASGEKRILEEGETYVVEDHGYREAEQANQGANASLWTQLALAYAIHKSFIFIRVPLTAAVTPKVVKTLRGWGWNIGKVPRRPGKGLTAAGESSKTGVNTKGSGVKPDN